MKTHTIASLADIAPGQWNSLVQNHNPFLRHEFLMAMERHRCVGERTGWLPHHIVCFDDAGCLAGAAPLYIKTDSFGEFVFDWSWADAYERHGLHYYPKLVSAVPFTPATGQRLLLNPGPQCRAVAQAVIEHTLEEARRLGCSSLHWLFTTEQDMTSLRQGGLLSRLGCQFHWHNPGYRDFTDFLATLSSKKRKNIKRERRLVQETSLEIRRLNGSEVSEAQWHAFYKFYSATFHRRGRVPYLSLPFFQDTATAMGGQMLLVLARHHGREVAGALSFASDTTLYGRYWGCRDDFDSLHFEACYYQGIEHCIGHGLKRFEPGAQGEHKIWRGFLPTLTHSAHWLAHPAFSAAIADFLRRETPAIEAYARELTEHSPYRESPSLSGETLSPCWETLSLSGETLSP